MRKENLYSVMWTQENGLQQQFPEQNYQQKVNVWLNVVDKAVTQIKSVMEY